MDGCDVWKCERGTHEVVISDTHASWHPATAYAVSVFFSRPSLICQ
jgi:hypothetical protein